MTGRRTKEGILWLGIFPGRGGGGVSFQAFRLEAIRLVVASTVFSLENSTGLGVWENIKP